MDVFILMYTLICFTSDYSKLIFFQYLFDGIEHPVTPVPHGNNERQFNPGYRRTKDSTVNNYVMHHLKHQTYLTMSFTRKKMDFYMRHRQMINPGMEIRHNTPIYLDAAFMIRWKRVCYFVRHNITCTSFSHMFSSRYETSRFQCAFVLHLKNFNTSANN